MAERKRAASSGAAERKNVPRGRVHQVDVQQHDRDDHRPHGHRDLRGARAGIAGFKGSRKSTPYAAELAAEAPPARMEHGLRQVEVYVKGPGAGREQAIRSLQAAGLRSAPSRRHADPAQRLPPAEAAPGLRPRGHGPLHRPRLPALPPRRA